MRGFIAVAVTLMLLACGNSEPPLAGSMSERSICDTAGYIIRQNLGSGFKTAGVGCGAKSVGGGAVEITSGYVSPLGPTLRYTARAVVSGNRLKMEEIMVHGVDDQFAPFAEFGQ